MNCARCDETYSVFGIALYCVSCGQLAPSVQFTELLEVQHRALGRLDELPEDQRRSWEADGFFAKIYEDTIKATFGALENFLGQVFRSRVSNADEILSGKGNIFQRLAGASALFDQHLDTKLDGLNPAAWAVLINAAALRHLLTHKDGIVDQKYLQQIPTSQYRIGQRVHVNRVDAERLLDAATRLGQDHHRQLTNGQDTRRARYAETHTPGSPAPRRHGQRSQGGSPLIPPSAPDSCQTGEALPENCGPTQKPSRCEGMGGE